MSRDEHAVGLSEPYPWRPKRRHYYSAHNLATRVTFGTQASVYGSDHCDVDRVFVGLFWEQHCRWLLDRALELWRTTGRHECM